jgi:hypothetical protein
MQQRSELSKVQQRWGGPRTGVSTLSEAATVLEAALVQEVINEVALQAWTQASQGNAVAREGGQELVWD